MSVSCCEGEMNEVHVNLHAYAIRDFSAMLSEVGQPVDGLVEG